MLNKSLIGVFFVTFIYLLAIFLKQPLEYVFNLQLLPLSLLSLILGIFFFNIFSLSSNVVEGREFIKKYILQLAIVLLGIKISLAQLWRVSIESIFIVIITILLVFLTYILIKKIWPTQKGLSKLLAIGTSICGVTAIMASSTILKSKNHDVAVAVLVVVLWGTIAVFTYPFFVELFFLTDLAKGIFLGVSIHDTSQVLAAAMVHNDLHPNQKTLEIATITKIIRNLFLLVLIPLLIFFNKSAKNNKNKSQSVFVKIFNSIPIFVIGFILFIIFRSIMDLYFFDNERWIQFLVMFEKIISILFGLALTALGASIDLRKIFNQGYAAVLIGMTFSFVSLLSVTLLIYILGLNVL
tara:strand:+ start:85 stop:1143 length:1059 start_codon:yes stop_codon:yes gene_type:complete